MGHHCNFIDRVEIEEDFETETRYLVRVVEANYKEYALDVYKEYESGGYYDHPYMARNLWFNTCGGYLVSFPGEKQYSRYGYNGYRGCNVYEQVLEDWTLYSKSNLYCSNVIDYQSEANIIEIHPNFKYVLKKMHPADKSVARVMELLETWKQHPEIEGLCQLGFYDIANNKNLFKLSLPKRKKIIQWIMKNAKLVNYPQYMKLVHIQKMINYNMSIDEYKDYDMNCPNISKRITWNQVKKYHPDIPTWRYLKKKDFTAKDKVIFYWDYLQMAERVGHDIKDEYWKFPSDINKAHAKVMEELDNLKSTASALQGEYLKAVMQPLADKFNATVDGYEIFLPVDIESVKKQCDVLYQCLLRNNYVNNVLMQDEILVFIHKDGVPVATAQVYYDGKIGQFYGDERGHKYGEDCKPPQDVQDAFDKWMKTFKPYKVAAERKKSTKVYYKGFHSVDSKGVYHTSFGNYSFEVGKVYATDFLDNEIEEAGGSKCVATNKVFHFCENINEIQRHYSPTCYAEVEALGPVVECNGAFLSNRIKITRALSSDEVKMLMVGVEQLIRCIHEPE